MVLPGTKNLPERGEMADPEGKGREIGERTAR